MKYWTDIELIEEETTQQEPTTDNLEPRRCYKQHGRTYFIDHDDTKMKGFFRYLVTIKNSKIVFFLEKKNSKIVMIH